MDQRQKELLINCVLKHYGDDDGAYILRKFPLTGPSGLRRKIAEKDPEYFCLAYLTELFDREFGSYAIEWMTDMDNAINTGLPTKEARVGPRGHAKSTINTVAMPTKAAAYQKRKYILFISANEDTASNFLAKVKKALESPAITEDFGPQKGRVWNNFEIETINGVTVECAGWTSGIRGKNKDRRPDLVIFDDLEDKKVMESPSLRSKLEKSFEEEMLKLGDFDTIYWYVGTLLAVDSLLAKVIKKPTWKSKTYKKVISFPDSAGEKLWEEWRKIFRNIANENRMDDAYKFYLEHKAEMIAGVKMLWEGKYPYKEGAFNGAYYNTMLEREESEDAFWKEDQNEPKESSDMPFKQLSFWQDVFGDCPVLPSTKLAIDPSEGKGLDGTAYAIGGKTNGAVILKDGQLRNDKLNAIMQHVVELIKQYPEIDEVILEENTYKEDGTEQLRKYLVDHESYRKVTGFRATDNKHNRIIQMEPDINTGSVLFNKLNVAFNNQVLKYSARADHDDAADVTHKLWKTLKVPAFCMK